VRVESAPAASTYVHVTYFEAYDTPTRILETTCQYQTLDDNGELQRSHVRLLRQRVHSSIEIRDAAASAGFAFVAYTLRNQAVPVAETAIGGTFEFRLPE
jgi:hypothetical protein